MRASLELVSPIVILIGIGGCSIDFVSLDEPPVRTVIQITSSHTDSLRVQARIDHRGSVVEAVGVNDERRFSAGSAVTDEATFELDLTVNPVEPVLDVYVDQHPSAPELLELQVPLLVRAGTATCSPEGALTLPFAFDESGSVGYRSSWGVELVDPEGRAVVSLQSESELPRPVTVVEELVDTSATTARLRIEFSGPVEDAPYEAFLGVSTAAEWAVPDGCP